MDSEEEWKKKEMARRNRWGRRMIKRTIRRMIMKMNRIRKKR